MGRDGTAHGSISSHSRAREIVVPQGMMGSADSSRTNHALGEIPHHRRPCVLPPKPAALLLEVSLAGIDTQPLADVGWVVWLELMARPCALPPIPATLALDVRLSGAHWAKAAELMATSAPARRIDFMNVSANWDGGFSPLIT